MINTMVSGKGIQVCYSIGKWEHYVSLYENGPYSDHTIFGVLPVATSHKQATCIPYKPRKNKCSVKTLCINIQCSSQEFFIERGRGVKLKYYYCHSEKKNNNNTMHKPDSLKTIKSTKLIIILLHTCTYTEFFLSSWTWRTRADRQSPVRHATPDVCCFFIVKIGQRERLPRMRPPY